MLAGLDGEEVGGCRARAQETSCWAWSLYSFLDPYINSCCRAWRGCSFLDPYINSCCWAWRGCSFLDPYINSCCRAWRGWRDARPRRPRVSPERDSPTREAKLGISN